MTTVLETRHHALYRFFDAHDALLYVGISAALPQRLDTHDSEKPWWSDVSRVAIEHFDSRSAVLDAERHAIQTERPRHNKTHNGPRTARLRPPHRTATPSQITSTVFGVSNGGAYAFGLVTGECPVGIVVESGLRGDVHGYRIALFNWLAGEFGGAEEFVSVHDVKRWRRANELSRAAKRRQGFDISERVFDMDPLAEFQTKWCQHANAAAA